MADFNVITLKEFANSIHKPESTVRTWKRRGNMPASCFATIGNTVFVRVNAVQAFLDGEE